MQCQCQKCGMSVKGLQCGKCDAELVPHSIEKEGKQIKVAKCPNDCGMIKSPACCNQDMTCSL